MGKNARWDLTIVRRPKDAEGWVKLPIRWRVERTFAWLGNFRRLVVRYERTLRMYRAFFHVACLLVTLRQL